MSVKLMIIEESLFSLVIDSIWLPASKYRLYRCSRTFIWSTKKTCYIL